MSKTVTPLESSLQIKILEMKREREHLLRDADHAKVKAETLLPVIGKLESMLVMHSQLEPKDLR